MDLTHLSLDSQAQGVVEAADASDTHGFRRRSV